MIEIIDVQTGDIQVSGTQTMLVSNGIGSCIVIGLLDPGMVLGGMAHIMLPGRAPKKGDADALRYLETAVDELIDRLRESGADHSRFKAFLAGAGNVLKRDDDTICTDNIRNARQALSARHIVIVAESLGGTERRKVRMEVGSGSVFCALGDATERLLCRLA